MISTNGGRGRVIWSPERDADAIAAWVRLGTSIAAADECSRRWGVEVTDRSIRARVSDVRHQRPEDYERMVASAGGGGGQTEAVRESSTPLEVRAPKPSAAQPCPLPATGSFRMALLGCVHCDDGNTDLLRWAVDALRGLDVTHIRLMGDFVTCGPLSHWPRLTLDQSTWRRSVDVANGLLDQLQMLGPVDYLMGNHEDWAQQYVVAHPEMHGWVSVADNLHLDRRGIRYYGSNDAVVEPWGVFHHGHATKSGSTACTWYAKEYSPNFGYKLPVWIANWHHLGSADVASGAYCECTGYLGAFRPAYVKSSLPAWAWGFRVIDVEGGKVVRTQAVRYPRQ